MKFRLVLSMAALLALAACKQEAAPTEAAPAPTPAAEPAPAAPASAPAAETAPAGTTAPTAETAPATPAPAPVPYTGPALVPGVDYVEIAGGQPLDPLDGKIEVVEFFNYICPACNAFEPLMKQWKARQAADVRVTYVPAMFRPDFAAYAKAYYAAESLGIAAKSHDAVYRAVHIEGKLPGEGQKFDEDKAAAFYAQYGVSAEQFKNAMHSFAVNGKANKANQFALRSQLGGTPSIIVNGRYMVRAQNSWEDMLRVTDGLIDRERARATGAAAN